MNNLAQLILENTVSGKIDAKVGAELLKALKSTHAGLQEDIAIIGMSFRSSMADNINEFWENIKAGLDCIRDFPKARHNDLYAYMRFMNPKAKVPEYNKGGYLEEIDKFDYGFFKMSPKEASLTDPNQRLFLQTVYEAMEDAGYGGENLTGSRTGVYLGYNGTSSYMQLISRVEPSSFAGAIVGNTSSIIPSRISYLMDFKGPSLLIDTACSSSLLAVHMACQGIRAGECDFAIAGGVRLNSHPLKGESALGIDSPDGRTKTFDDGSDGTGWGEGVAAILLKPLERAVKDRDHIYAVIKGSAVNQDGKSIGITAPNAAAQEAVLEKAWENAGIHPETISYIEAHGTGTKLGDPIEIDGVRKAFGKYTDKKQFCAIGSVKTNIGHLDNLSGISGLIKAVLALEHGEIPPSLHFNRPNRKIGFENSPVYVTDRLTEWKTEGAPKRCGVSSFGLSGTNCHMVLEEAPVCRAVENNEAVSQILAFSAKAREVIPCWIKKVADHLRKNPGINLRDFCYSANTGRGHYRFRLALVVSDLRDLQKKLEVLSLRDPEALQEEGIFYSDAEAAGSEGGKLAREARKITGEYVSGKRTNHELLFRICHLYVSGANVDWKGLYTGTESKIRLPVYPFEQKRCWIEQLDKFLQTTPGIRENRYYKTAWNPEPAGKPDIAGMEGAVLIFRDSSVLGSRIAARLRSQGTEVFEVEAGMEYRKIDSCSFSIRDTQADYDKLIAEIKDAGICRILHLYSMGGNETAMSAADLEMAQNKGAYSLFRLTRALQRNNVQKEIGILLISKNVYEITGGETLLYPENATLFGLSRIIGMENLNLKTRCLDVDETATEDTVLNELNSGYSGHMAAYRMNTRYAEVIDRYDISDLQAQPKTVRDSGVYIITGGTGTIGLNMASFLASKKKVKLALLNRSALPAREQWDACIREGTDPLLCSKLIQLKSIEEQGSEVIFYRVDVSDEIQLKGALDEIRSKYGKIDGILHCAGIGIGREAVTVSNETEEEFIKILSPKVNGTWLLERLTRNDSLDFLVLFSSAITLVGGIGIGGYIAANAYQDAFAGFAARQGCRVLTVNWPSWKDTVEKPGHDIDEDKQLFKIISTPDAVEALENLLGRNVTRAIVGQLNFDGKLFYLRDYLPFRLSEGIMAEYRHEEEEQGSGAASGQEENTELLDVKLTGRENDRYSETERHVAQVWKNILGFETFSVKDNLYELGGDSIHATRIVNGVNKRLQIQSGLAELLTKPTIEAFAAYIEESCLAGDTDEKVFLSIPSVEKADFYPVSAAQKRLFILNQIEESSTNYNIPLAMKMEGKLDRERFEMALKLLLKRHETLRTSFGFAGGEVVQRVRDEVELKVEYLTAEENEVKNILRGFIRPFELDKDPLFRVALVKTAEEEHILLFDIHHIISDGTSTGIIISEFLNLYQCNALPELKVQYKDFSVWQNKLFASNLIKKQEKYWLDLFAGDIPALDMPADYPRPSIQSSEGRLHVFHTGSSLNEGIRNLVSKTGTTLYMVLLAAFNILLLKYTGQQDIIVGSPIAGRRHTDLENLIGMFVNTLAMRNHPEQGKGFLDFLEDVRQNSLKAFENQDYQFEELVEKLNTRRDLSRNPLFDVMLVLQNTGMGSGRIEGLRFTPYAYEHKISKFDMMMTVVENENDLTCTLEYCTKLFRRETAERFAAHFIRVLETVVENPGIELGKIEILTAEEKNRILFDFNNTRAEYPETKTLTDVFEEQAEKNPQSIAVVFGEKTLSYAQLNHKANRLAGILREKGIGPDSIAGLLVERSLEMIVGILGILKAGGAYLPISPDYPVDRIAYMLEDSKAKILLTQDRFMGRLDTTGASGGSCLPDTVPVMNLEDETIYSAGCSNPEKINKSTDLAYVIYTSGSTGKPKGAMIEHRSAVNRIHWMQKKYPIGETDTILQKTPYTFDVSVWELFWWSFAGARVVMLEPGGEKDPAAIVHAIEKNKVTTMHFVPSMLSLFLEHVERLRDKSGLASLRRVFASGEALGVRQVGKFNQLLYEGFGSTLNNLYGPTEATVDVSYFDCSPGENLDVIPIGKPIDNIKLYVLDGEGTLAPVGIPGELCIAGDGVGRGYLNRPELTAERFVRDPFFPGNRMYRTGDLARWMEDGNIEYLGRMDHQVKIRGFRIELGEIEKCLSVFEGIKECVVLAKEDALGDKYLAAYYVSVEEIPVSGLMAHLAKDLPDYMIPGVYVHLKEMPLSSNGKVNRKALPEPDNNRPVLEVEYMEPVTEAEKNLVSVWKEILKLELIGINDNFFELGGNSLKLIQAHSRIDQIYPGKTNVVDLFSYPTISKLSGFIEQGEDTAGNAVDIAVLEFPTEYFVEEGESNEDSVLGFSVGEETAEELSAISQNNGTGLPDILLASYIYLFSEISEKQQVTVQVWSDADSRYRSVDLDLGVIEDFGGLFKATADKTADTGGNNSYFLRDAGRIRAVKARNSIVPLFSGKGSPAGDYMKISDIFLKFEEQKGQLHFSCEYNASRLKAEKIRELMQAYVKLIKLIIKHMKAN